MLQSIYIRCLTNAQKQWLVTYWKSLGEECGTLRSYPINSQQPDFPVVQCDIGLPLNGWSFHHKLDKQVALLQGVTAIKHQKRLSKTLGLV